jgi:mRNA interferase MazF
MEVVRPSQPGPASPLGQPRQDEVWLVSLDPTRGSEMQKTRPCLIVSPEEMNRHLRTLLVAPMTTVERAYPTRVAVTFAGKHGQIALDQLRSVDRQRLLKKLGKVSPGTAHAVSSALVEMFTRE